MIDYIVLFDVKTLTNFNISFNISLTNKPLPLSCQRVTNTAIMVSVSRLRCIYIFGASVCVKIGKTLTI